MDTAMKVRDLSYLMNCQRPAREFFKDAQAADRGSDSVINLVSSSLDEVKSTLDTFVVRGEGLGCREEVDWLFEELIMREEKPDEDKRAEAASRRVDEIAMSRVELGIVHAWREGSSSTESVCGGCGLGIDWLSGSALFFSEESSRILWSEWRTGVAGLMDEELLVAMADAEVAFLTRDRKGWEDFGRPAYAALEESKVLRDEIARRELDWDNREARLDGFVSSARRKSGSGI